MPVACSVVSTSLVSVVSLQPSTVMAEPSDVTALTLMLRLSGLKMSKAPPLTKEASCVPPPVCLQAVKKIVAVMSTTPPNFLKALCAFCFELLLFIVIFLHKDMS